MPRSAEPKLEALASGLAEVSFIFVVHLVDNLNGRRPGAHPSIELSLSKLSPCLLIYYILYCRDDGLYSRLPLLQEKTAYDLEHDVAVFLPAYNNVEDGLDGGSSAEL